MHKRPKHSSWLAALPVRHNQRSSLSRSQSGFSPARLFQSALTKTAFIGLLCGLTLAAGCALSPASHSKASDGGSAKLGLKAGPTASSELISQILAADELFFAAMFDKNDAETLTSLVTDDFEFFHDKFGQIANSRDEFVEKMRQQFEMQKQGTNFRARRELVRDSVAVYPLNNYGALQMGIHRFYAVSPGEPDRLTETGRFTTVWKMENGQWRIARALSYDHVLAK